MRIAIDIHMIGDKSGGNETYYRNILSNLSIENHDVFLLVYKDIDLSFVKTKFTPIYFKSKNGFIRNYIELRKIVRKYKIDLLHTQYFMPNIKKCKKIVSIFDISFEHFKDIFKKTERIVQKILIRKSAKNADKIITISEFSRKDIIQKYEISDKKIEIVYCAANDDFKPLHANENYEEYLKAKFNIKKPFILTVGNLQPRKNLSRLLIAYNQLSKIKPCFPLVIVGKKAWLYNQIFETIDIVGQEESVILTDYIEHDDLVKLYKSADAFIYPSIFEGFGLPVVEAMACGIKTATSNVSSLPEVAGKHAILFDPYSIDEISAALEQLMQYQLETNEKESIISSAKKFDWKKSSKVIENIYDEVLGGN